MKYKLSNILSRRARSKTHMKIPSAEGQLGCPPDIVDKYMNGSANNSSFTDDERFAVACALRDWIHEQPFSECGPGADTCPDWPLAFEIRDVALNALERFFPDN